MSWLFDAPTGVFRNHALSSDIRTEAMRDALFAQYASTEGGYGKGRGAAVTITRVMQLALAGRVSDVDRLPTGRPAVDTKQVAVSEWGFAIETTQFEENLTHYDMRNKFQQMLRSQMTLTIDKMHADANRTSPIVAVPTTASNLTIETAPATFAANSNLTIAHLRVIKDRLTQNQIAPPFRNGLHIGILTTRAARGIKNDPEYKDWLAPTENAIAGEARLRNVEGFALFVTNHQAAMDDTLGTPGVCGEAHFFGDDHAFTAVVSDPEIRAGMPEDLGRFRKVGWVATLEAGLVWDTAALTRVIPLGST